MFNFLATPGSDRQVLSPAAAVAFVLVNALVLCMLGATVVLGLAILLSFELMRFWTGMAALGLFLPALGGPFALWVVVRRHGWSWMAPVMILAVVLAFLITAARVPGDLMIVGALCAGAFTAWAASLVVLLLALSHVARSAPVSRLMACLRP